MKRKIFNLKLFRLKNLFFILLAIFIIKLIFILGWLFSMDSLIKAQESQEVVKVCPPEITQGLALEKERWTQKWLELESKERNLKLLEARLQEQLTVLKELEATLDEKLKKIEAIQDERMKLLVKAYSEMKPSKAAQSLMNMDREMAVKILSQLKSDQVASILSAMPPEKAADLSQALSGFPPKEIKD